MAFVVESEGVDEARLGFISEGDCLEHLSNDLFYGNPMPDRSARSIMKAHPVCVDPDTDLFTLASVFVNHRLRHLPVVENHSLLGIVSRRDILRATDEYYRDLLKKCEQERFRPDLSQIVNHRFIVRGPSR